MQLSADIEAELFRIIKQTFVVGGHGLVNQIGLSYLSRNLPTVPEIHLLFADVLLNHPGNLRNRLVAPGTFPAVSSAAGRRGGAGLTGTGTAGEATEVDRDVNWVGNGLA